jgi:hypothetical protein
LDVKPQEAAETGSAMLPPKRMLGSKLMYKPQWSEMMPSLYSNPPNH